MLTSLPLAVLTTIAQHVPRTDLPALARTCRTLQAPAEATLHADVLLRTPDIAFAALLSLSARDYTRAGYVRRLWVYPLRRAPWPEAFWRGLARALPHMPLLSTLVLHDESGAHAWVLDGDPALPCRLTDAVLAFAWDAHLLAFLESQDRLRSLSLLPSGSAVAPPPLQEGSLPALTTLEAPMHAARALLACKALRKLALLIDDEGAGTFAGFLHALARARTPLSSLHVVAVPEFLVVDALAALGGAPALAGSLRHLGVLALPLTSVRPPPTQQHPINNAAATRHPRLPPPLRPARSPPSRRLPLGRRPAPAGAAAHGRDRAAHVLPHAQAARRLARHRADAVALRARARDVGGYTASWRAVSRPGWALARVLSDRKGTAGAQVCSSPPVFLGRRGVQRSQQRCGHPAGSALRAPRYR